MSNHLHAALLMVTPLHCAQVAFFSLEVNCPSVGTFFLRRRFRDFDALHAALSRQFGGQTVPELPPKQLIKQESAEFLQARKEALGAFLSQLIAHETYSTSRELWAFLECEAAIQLATRHAALAAEALAANAALEAELRRTEQNASFQASEAAAEIERARAAARAADARNERSCMELDSSREQVVRLLAKRAKERRLRSVLQGWRADAAPVAEETATSAGSPARKDSVASEHDVELPRDRYLGLRTPRPSDDDPIESSSPGDLSCESPLVRQLEPNLSPVACKRPLVHQLETKLGLTDTHTHFG